MKRAESDFVLVPKSAHSKNMLVFSLQRRVIIQEAKSRISQGCDMFESGLVIFVVFGGSPLVSVGVKDGRVMNGGNVWGLAEAQIKAAFLRC